MAPPCLHDFHPLPSPAPAAWRRAVRISAMLQLLERFARQRDEAGVRGTGMAAWDHEFRTVARTACYDNLRMLRMFFKRRS